MQKILFICYGNMCRSPMAEFVMRHLVDSAGRSRDFIIDSAGVGYNIAGELMAREDMATMDAHGVPYKRHISRQFEPGDYDSFDHIIAMDSDNYDALMDLSDNDPDGKISMMLSYVGEDRDVDDPYYTGDYEKAYQDIRAGCEALLKTLI